MPQPPVPPPSPAPPPFHASLRHPNTPLVLDGALATQLERFGVSLNTALWSAAALHTHPHLIRAVHRAYYLAGAHVATTASYQATPAGFAGFAGRPSVVEADDAGTDTDMDAGADALRLIRLSVTLAQEARAEALAELRERAHHRIDGEQQERPLYVAGSVGPYGAHLADGSEYTGAYGPTLTEASLQAFHRARIAALLRAGADVLALETIPSAGEARALCSLLAAEFPAAQAWLSFSLRDAPGARGSCIADGTPLREAVAGVAGCAQIVAVGVNCVAPSLVGPALRELAATAPGMPLLCYPNSGEMWDAKGRCWKPGGKQWEAEGEGLGEAVRGWIRDGARMVGLCCRSAPEDIKVVARHAR